MSTVDLIFLSGTIAAFIVFAGVLGWVGHDYTRSRNGKTASGE